MTRTMFRFLLLYLCLYQVNVSAAYSLKNGQLKDTKYIAFMDVKGHFSVAIQAYEDQDFRVAVKHFNIVLHSFPSSSYADEARFFLGVQYYKLGDLEKANTYFSDYMLSSKHTKYFEKVITYRLAIANLYAEGRKKHLFGLVTMPQIMSGYEDALGIYEEIIMLLPNHEQAAKALFLKAELELKIQDFDLCSDTLKTLFRRFQRSEYTSKAYLLIGKLYLIQTELESHNQDLLDLARMNLRNFTKKFPRHEGANQLEANLRDMEEIYSDRLFKTGQFYERTQRPQSSVIYYSQVISEFSNTRVAKLSKERLQVLSEYAISLGLN